MEVVCSPRVAQQVCGTPGISANLFAASFVGARRNCLRTREGFSLLCGQWWYQCLVEIVNVPLVL
eukprot:3881433-Amphidinium_carterae.1